MWMNFPSANFGAGEASTPSVILAAEARGMPAPETSLATISRSGRVVTAWMRSRRRALGADPASVFVPHPIQDRTDDELRALADGAFQELLATLTNP